MQAPPPLTCVFGVNKGLEGWQKMLNKIFQGIRDLVFSIDVSTVYLRGEVDPRIFIKKLYKAETYVVLYRIDYGYEENPEGTRKPNSHFMRCIFELNTLEISWCNKIIGALKIIQGVSFTIDAPTQMGYLQGNIESGVLMKMLVKTGIETYRMDYGVESTDARLKPPPKNLEAPQNGTETQPAKDTVPPPPPPPHEVNSTSTNYQAEYKKPRGFRRFFFK